MKGRTRRAAKDPALQGFGSIAAARPRVAVYYGEGASHSWIWFADLLERLSLFDVNFVTHSDVLTGALDRAEVLLVGGGDTYAIAGALGEAGAAAIREFVEKGGFYHGSCAGAYLVLSGVDIAPFTPFDLVEGDMVNVMRDPPAPRCMAHKYLAPYGDDRVFHPVYGEVLLSVGPAAPGRYALQPPRLTGAPLFGGPVMAIPDESCRLADYAGTTERAAFPWPPEEVERLIEGRQAVALRVLGAGTVVASGPHLEHPLYPRANALIAGALKAHLERRGDMPREHGDALRGRPVAGGGRPGRDTSRGVERALLEIRRQVSNARIVAFGLEQTAVTWRIGVKVWEPEKIRMFLECAWDRLPGLGDRCATCAEPPLAELEELADRYASVTGLARTLKLEVESGRESGKEASVLLDGLKETTADFFSLCFGLRLAGQAGETCLQSGERGRWP